MKELNIKVTKTKLLKEVSNDMAHNFYYLVHGRIINENNTFTRFRIVLWFDIFDVQDFFEKEIISKNDLRLYLDEVINSYFISQTDKTEFISTCNETINNYNNINNRSVWKDEHCYIND